MFPFRAERDRPPARSFLFLSLICAFSFPSCAHKSKEPVSIHEVRYYHLTSTAPIRTPDPMVRLFPETLLYGATQPDEIIARLGNYYWVYWRAPDRSQPVTVKMEYRQAKDPTTLKTLQVTYDKPKWYNKTEFLVTGQPYLDKGRVFAWRFSVLQGAHLIDIYESFLWKKSEPGNPADIKAQSLLDTSQAVMTIEDDKIITTAPPYQKKEAN